MKKSVVAIVGLGGPVLGISWCGGGPSSFVGPPTPALESHRPCQPCSSQGGGGWGKGGNRVRLSGNLSASAFAIQLWTLPTERGERIAGFSNLTFSIRVNLTTAEEFFEHLFSCHWGRGELPSKQDSVWEVLSSPSPWCNYNFSFAFANVMLFPVFNLSHLFTLNLYKDSYVWGLLFCKSHCVASARELFQFKILEDHRRFRSTTRTISWQLSYSIQILGSEIVENFSQNS